MIDQYPHIIDITMKTPPVQDEETGLFVPGVTSYQNIKCRAEVNGKGQKIAGNDGVLMDYAFICYLPKMNTVIPVESEYTLYMDNATSSGKVKRASNGQLSSRLWL